ncbi:MAG TPA: hypothetical protein VEQ60_07085, partial [Longimicrobium sp.]|nr:hypothetical protein [Longimicrobium sp.]
TLMGYDLVIEWRPGRGFGLSTPSAGDQFLGPDEVYEDLDSAYERAKALLLSQTPTKPPVDATLPELRRTRRPSQVDMAQQLSIDHSACSRMEWRSDILVGTVRDVVAAMGGELKLLAEFPHRTLEIQIDQILNGDAPRAS